ncbi:MAG: pseudaminic acid cytidylyltransferase [Burkholderiaceae bacterium]|nr:pseudaminic acid cytidylyltransferase [Rhodoferax sp.]MCP5286223.1 pseudaminic acid cytidylyltransferase [Burkholderiaceae bacterium]
MKLAIIPARGGSKRIPRKNVKPFCGKPMIGYAIDAARRAEVFDRIVVSTDDAEIADVARAAGAEVPFMRPDELANDQAATVPVIAHAIGALAAGGSAPSLVCCIYPGVPLLRHDDLRRSLAMLEDGTSDYVFPVLEFPAAVQRALLREADGRVRPMYPQFTLTRTQDLPPAYYDAGQFYWGRAQAWLDGHSPHTHGRAIVLAADTAVDIDTPDDWARAEALYQARQTLRSAA